MNSYNDDDFAVEMPVPVDCNGHELSDGDQVHLAKDLKVKGMSKTLKRGTKVKIRTTGDTDTVECKIGKATVVLVAAYLKKA